MRHPLDGPVDGAPHKAATVVPPPPPEVPGARAQRDRRPAARPAPDRGAPERRPPPDRSGAAAHRTLLRETALLDRLRLRLSDGLDAGRMVESVLAELRRAVPVDAAVLALLAADGSFRCAYGTGAGVPAETGWGWGPLAPRLLARLGRERAVVLAGVDGRGGGNGAHGSGGGACAFDVAPVSAWDRRPRGPDPGPGVRSVVEPPHALLGIFDRTEVTGFLALWARDPALLRARLPLLARVGGQLSLALGNRRVYEEMKALHLNTLKGLSSALNAKDYYTLGHAARVSAYTVLLLHELGWDPARLSECADAAFLHDIGKIGISDRVLLKQGALNAEEWELMKRHPEVSADIVRPLFSEEVARAVRHHHERFDGTGYPAGLAGEEIPELARALCVVDSYDAMSLNRPYRTSRSYRECVAELARCRGTQFDPHMVTAFLRVLGRLRRLRLWAKAVGEEAAARVDPEKHKLLREPADQERPEYEEIARAFREVRDAHPPVRYITTQAFSGRSKVVLVVDGEEDDSPDKTPLGEEFFIDEELQHVLTGREPDLVTLFADEFGVWLSKSVPLRDAEGRVVAAVAVDVPALHGIEAAGPAPSGPSSVVDAASARIIRAEIDSITDSLTGLYNHRYLHERLTDEVARAEDEGTELAVLFCDLDHFKRYNDRHGHSAGDRALRAVARVVEGCVRRVDLVGRYGGEELVVVLPETGAARAQEVAERIRAAVEAIDDPTVVEPLTTSIGIALYPGDARSKEELIDRADWSMYRAKRDGRNRVVAFAPGEGRMGPGAGPRNAKGRGAGRG